LIEVSWAYSVGEFNFVTVRAPSSIPESYAGYQQLPHDSRGDRLIGPIECDFVRDVWANAQALSDDLDHERDITLAIHAAIPDLTTDSIRSNPRFHEGGDGCASAVE
jgi:hypothetical protein